MGKLGDNFDSIFDDIFDTDESGGGINEIKLTDIEPNRNQPRKQFDTEKLNALAESIMEHGIIQPITVRNISEDESSPRWQIVAGERRFRAARIAGLREVPVRVMELSDLAAYQVALIENLQREDLNPINEAMGYSFLMEEYEMTQDEVAKKVGRARSSITNALRLLSLPEVLREYAANGTLSRGHCKALLAVPDETDMIQLGERAVKEDLSVRAVEKIAAVMSEKKSAEKSHPVKTRNIFFTEAEISLSDLIGHPVKIVENKEKNTLSIDFKSEEELKNILKLFEERV